MRWPFVLSPPRSPAFSAPASSAHMNMRFMEPFVGMFQHAATASQTILLSYLTASPLQVPLTAYDQGHYKVSWFSALGTISPPFPIFVGGLFTITGNRDTVFFQFSTSAFICVLAFLLIYCVSLPVAWPQMHRLLPKYFYSLADPMAMCHQSRFLTSDILDISKPQVTREHMVSRLFLREDKYLFGIYLGRDGKEHLGFDVAETGNVLSTKAKKSRPGMVRWVEPTGTHVHKFYWFNSRRGRKYLKNARRSNTSALESGEPVIARRPSDHGRTPQVRIWVTTWIIWAQALLL